MTASNLQLLLVQVNDVRRMGKIEITIHVQESGRIRPSQYAASQQNKHGPTKRWPNQKAFSLHEQVGPIDSTWRRNKFDRFVKISPTSLLSITPYESSNNHRGKRLEGNRTQANSPAVAAPGETSCGTATPPPPRRLRRPPSPPWHLAAASPGAASEPSRPVKPSCSLQDWFLNLWLYNPKRRRI